MEDYNHLQPFNGLFSRTTWVSRYTRKVKPIWILLEQETVSGSGISWAICKPASRSRQTTTPTPHHSFFTAGCPSCRPTNSVKALKSGRLKSKKLICSEVSVKSPGNPWSQSRRRKGRLWWERLTEKESFKPGVVSRRS